MEKIHVCSACGWGKPSTLERDIVESIMNYGEYICTNCQTELNRMAEGEGLFIETPNGKFETLVTDTEIYYLDKVDGVLKDPSTPLLGFGGLVFLIKKNTFINEVILDSEYILTNNLWLYKRIPKYFKDKIEANAEIICIDPNCLNGIKDQIIKFNALKRKD